MNVTEYWQFPQAGFRHRYTAWLQIESFHTFLCFQYTLKKKKIRLLTCEETHKFFFSWILIMLLIGFRLAAGKLSKIQTDTENKILLEKKKTLQDKPTLIDRIFGLIRGTRDSRISLWNLFIFFPPLLGFTTKIQHYGMKQFHLSIQKRDVSKTQT